jgi:hypothetical protein
LSLLLAVSGAAIGAEPAAPLPAGKPAGVKKAQEETNFVVLGVGVAAVAAGIALVASDDDDGPPVTTTSPTTTGTTP